MMPTWEPFGKTPIGGKVNMESFRRLHPYVITPNDNDKLEPLRFHNLRCAARTAIHLHKRVIDERDGYDYDMFYLLRVVNERCT